MSNNFVNEENKIEIVHKELELIQNTIQRMANNSFMIKGWGLTLFVGLITFFNISKLSTFVLGISLIVVICSFYCLDAFFIWTERKYRRLYNDVITKRVNEDYSNLYSLDCSPYENESILDVILNTEYKKQNTATQTDNNESKKNKEKKRNTLAMYYIPMILVACLFIISAFIPLNSKIDKIEHEISITEINSQIDKLSISISNLKKQSEEISTKSISIVSDITSEKETIDNINHQIKSINEQITQLLPLINQKDEKNNDNTLIK